MIEQLETLIKEVPPQKQKTDQTLWPWFNLRLISESLQILLLMFVRPDFRHGGTQKQLLRLLKIFQVKTHSFICAECLAVNHIYSHLRSETYPNYHKL